MTQRSWWRPVRWLLVVVAVFAAGVGIYAAALAWWPVLLIWWSYMLAGAIGVAVLGAWWLWWRLPKWQVDDLGLTIYERANAEDNFRKTAGQLLGGTAVLAGAAFAYLQFTQQQQAAHDLLISNQVSKGFELLGNKDDKVQQRPGGIYALEGVMNDNTSSQYQGPVLDALCDFVRDETKAKTDDPPRSDVQATLTVIGRRRAPGPLVVIDMSGLDRAGGIEVGKGRIDLRNAHLPKADLDSADLILADLRGADLRGANLTLADLIWADLSNADLHGAILDSADITNANLSGAKGLTDEQLNRACGGPVRGLDTQLHFRQRECTFRPAIKENLQMRANGR
jgi:uncharacterized protein YjbI with pentapeptide repeats